MEVGEVYIFVGWKIGLTRGGGIAKMKEKHECMKDNASKYGDGRMGMQIKDYTNSEQEQKEVLHFLESVLPESGRNLDDDAIKQYVKSLEDFDKVWCLFDRETLIGTVGIRRLDERNCELKALYLYSKYHGQGLGYRLITTALEEAKQAGYEAMYLDTISTSERAIKLYKAVGFEEIEQYKETIRSDVFMRKRL